MIYKSDVLVNKMESVATEVVSMSAISCFDQIGRKDAQNYNIKNTEKTLYLMPTIMRKTQNVNSHSQKMQ